MIAPYDQRAFRGGSPRARRSERWREDDRADASSRARVTIERLRQKDVDADVEELAGSVGEIMLDSSGASSDCLYERSERIVARTGQTENRRRLGGSGGGGADGLVAGGAALLVVLVQYCRIDLDGVVANHGFHRGMGDVRERHISIHLVAGERGIVVVVW